MSHKATNHVFELTKYPDGTKIERDEKLLLFVLADHHNVSTQDAFPSVKRLADLALMSERHARDILRKAERHGLIETVHGGGRGNTSSYRFATLDKVGTACLVLTGKEADLELGNSANNSAPCLPGLEINSAQTRQKGGTDAFANKEEPKNLEPNTTNRKRRSRTEIFEPFSDEAKSVVNRVLEIWPHKRSGNNSKIQPDLALLANRVDELLKNPQLNSHLLIRAAERYLAEPREFPHAPEFFFGPGKTGGDGPPWRHYARLEWYEQNKTAAAAAAGVQ